MTQKIVLYHSSLLHTYNGNRREFIIYATHKFKILLVQNRYVIEVQS